MNTDEMYRSVNQSTKFAYRSYKIWTRGGYNKKH